MAKTSPSQSGGGKPGLPKAIPVLALSCTMAMIMILSVPVLSSSAHLHMDRPDGIRRMLTILNNQAVANHLNAMNRHRGTILSLNGQSR